MTPAFTILFDIDGTLTDTNAVDDECYCNSIAAELAISASEVDWSGAPHITDSGIADWLWQQHLGRLPTADELSRVRNRFVALLRDRLGSAPDQFAAIPGACDALARLRSESYVMALATGAWAESARLKLGAARIPAAGIPLVSADDASTREEIVTLALQKCSSPPGVLARRVVSVGDGLWDVATARHLSLPFVGIATGERAERLTLAGASHVLPDLQYERLISALTLASVPS